MSEKNINLSDENLNIIKNLNNGDLITIKHKKFRGKVVLRVLDDNTKSCEK